MRILVFLFLSCNILSQDLNYVRYVCHVLCSKPFAGRAYTAYPNEKQTGIEKARKFIVQEIKNNGAYDLNKYIEKSHNFSKPVHFQKLKFSDNKLPPIEFLSNNILSSMFVINGKSLILGEDYLPDASVPTTSFTGVLIKVDSVHYINKEKKIILQSSTNLLHSAADSQHEFTLIHIKNNTFSELQNEINCSINIKSELKKIKTNNIDCFIPGTQYPDTFLVFSAHYDHLGNIDTTYFPGANDNASGVAVLLDLMRFYKNHPPKYSVAFFFFTGEEIGLKGSEYYIKNPLFDLKRIKFLINLDLMGGGSEGIMVVNGKIFQKEFELLNKINQDKKYNINIKARGKAQNSDHYWFTEKSVKCFFIYTLGDITNYHNLKDKPEDLKFTRYREIFDIITNFMNEL